MDSIVEERYDSEEEESSPELEEQYSVVYSEDEEEEEGGMYEEEGMPPSSSRRKRVRRCTVAPEVKKDNHKERERARRNLIKDRFAYLRSTVPSLHRENSGSKLARTEILDRVIDYIQFMRGRNQTHMMQIEALRQGNVNLQEQWKGLHAALRSNMRLGAYVEPTTGEVVVDGLVDRALAHRISARRRRPCPPSSAQPTPTCHDNPPSGGAAGDSSPTLVTFSPPPATPSPAEHTHVSTDQLPPPSQVAAVSVIRHMESTHSVAPADSGPPLSSSVGDRRSEPTPAVRAVVVNAPVATNDEQVAEYDSPEEELIALSELKPSAAEQASKNRRRQRRGRGRGDCTGAERQHDTRTRVHAKRRQSPIPAQSA